MFVQSCNLLTLYPLQGPPPFVRVMATSAVKLLEQYGLCEEECNGKVTDEHLLTISRSYCKKWRSLYPYLDMKRIDVAIAEHDGNGEENERLKFLEIWKAVKGCDATYKKLIDALLKVECRNDAEGVCELLKTSPPPLAQPGMFTSYYRGFQDG